MPPSSREAIAEEIADAAILLTYLAHDLNVEMEEAACLRQVNAPEAAEDVSSRTSRNAEKYPVEKARGVAIVGSVVALHSHKLRLVCCS